ncbi:MAG: type II toxin-antitoxin system VapC family toxin [Thermoleophilaceae bacterium]|nr:type II toxin-antitoxin system VapC family toxin [Thermoleophilaceae bacterium]
MIYVDSSALFKLIWPEPESKALLAVIADEELVSSDLLVTELRRTAVRHAPPNLQPFKRVLLERADAICSDVDLIPVDTELLLAAGELEPISLRSLDAIHIASALSAEADGFLTYDRRQSDAARSVGLTVLAPVSS